MAVCLREMMMASYEVVNKLKLKTVKRESRECIFFVQAIVHASNECGLSVTISAPDE